jgi:hypothetical protein
MMNEPVKDSKLVLIGRDAVELAEKRVPKDAAGVATQTKIVKIQGQFDRSLVGPVWGVSVMIPSAMVGRPILVYCEARNGMFTLVGQVEKKKGGGDGVESGGDQGTIPAGVSRDAVGSEGVDGTGERAGGIAGDESEASQGRGELGDVGSGRVGDAADSERGDHVGGV